MGHGGWWRPRMCRSSYCESRCATIATPRRTSPPGAATSPRAGASTGDRAGKSAGADGTTGTASPFRTPRRCQHTSGSIQATAILARQIIRSPFAPRTTTTSRMKPWCSARSRRKRTRTWGARRRTPRRTSKGGRNRVGKRMLGGTRHGSSRRRGPPSTRLCSRGPCIKSLRSGAHRGSRRPRSRSPRRGEGLRGTRGAPGTRSLIRRGSLILPETWTTPRNSAGALRRPVDQITPGRRCNGDRET